MTLFFISKHYISQHNASFSFQTVTVDKLRGLSAKQAPGYDSIPSKLVKVDAHVLRQPFA